MNYREKGIPNYVHVNKDIANQFYKFWQRALRDGVSEEVRMRYNLDNVLMPYEVFNACDLEYFRMFDTLDSRPRQFESQVILGDPKLLTIGNWVMR